MADTMERCGGLCVLSAGHAGGCYAPVTVRTEEDAARYWVDFYRSFQSPSDRARDQRILEIVMAPGTELYPSKLNGGMVVLVNGLTGLDACENSAEDCFDVLLREEDGGMSPGRIELVIDESGAPRFVTDFSPRVSAVTNPITSENAPEGANEVSR
jgi:hypothetical protein